MSGDQYSSDLPEVNWRSQHKMGSSSNYRAFVSTHHFIDNSTASSSFRASPRQLHRQPIRTGAMHCSQSTASAFKPNNGDEEELVEERAADDSENNYRTFSDFEQELGIPKVPLFEKPLTPSDVGKLNRLVIPKQHAEKYFPMNGGDKVLILNFEDEVGKSWRFRYSYWNSSQSYVLTKGWSRFVREKRLYAGDIVFFTSHHKDVDRLFIGWKRRNPHLGRGGGGDWRGVFRPDHPFYSPYQGSSALPSQPHSPLSGSVVAQNPTAAAAASRNPKRLRLFGVNLEWQADEKSEPSTSECSPMSSQGQAHKHPCYPNHGTHRVRIDLAAQPMHSPITDQHAVIVTPHMKWTTIVLAATGASIIREETHIAKDKICVGMWPLQFHLSFPRH